MSENIIKMGRYSIELSNLDKKMYPKSGITKQDVIEYYKEIAPYMLPHIQQRPLVMHRFPDGIEGENFYQKAVPDYFPDWIRRTKITLREGGSEYLMVVEKSADLVYLANQACLVPHVWLSREAKVENPDKLVFDLDPSRDDFGEVKFAALKLKYILEDKCLISYVMTTGSKGLHVTVPIKPEYSFDRVREYAEELARKLSKDYPDRLTTEPRKVKREGRLLLDYMRNSFGQTSVVPYALRALPGAPVAVPLDWKELKRSQLNPRTYNLNNIFRRLSQKEDPWKDMFRNRNKLKI
jgi:bifunctional non-homologous end joining protein LigD